MNQHFSHFKKNQAHKKEDKKFILYRIYESIERNRSIVQFIEALDSP